MRSESDFEKGFDIPSVLEQFVDFDKELAVIVARGEDGKIVAFPPVELEFNPNPEPAARMPPFGGCSSGAFWPGRMM